jgi:hypothetical protein
MLRVTDLSRAECRVDGWVAPAAGPMTVRVSQPTGMLNVLVESTGRFEIPRLAKGLTRFFLVADEAADDAEKFFATPTFEL